MLTLSKSTYCQSSILRLCHSTVAENITLHNTAKLGFGNDNVTRYNQGRADYHADGLQIVNRLINKGRKIVEVGAGTGKFTQSFLSTFSHFTADYAAIEPSDAFRNHLSEEFPSINVMNGFGESIDLPDNSADAVVVAQAFHWMANDKTVDEFHRILKPNCPLIMIWNTMSRTISWQQELEFNIVSKYYTRDVPRQQSYEWLEAFASPKALELFQHDSPTMHHTDAKQDVLQQAGVLNFWVQPRTVVCTEQTIVNRALSVSVISSQSDAVKQMVESQIRCLLHTHPDTKHISDDKYTVVYNTEMSWSFAV